MELLFEQYNLNQSEEPCEESTPKKEIEENLEPSEYDYNKRLWF
jgi:hypothetical protein